MVELIVVISILGILAAVVGPRFSSPDVFSTASSREDAMSLLRQAQKQAVKERRRIYANLSGQKLELCRSSTFPCPAGSEVLGFSGSGASSATIATGVVMAGAASIYFDPNGKASAKTTFTLTKGAETTSFIVEKDTGFVHD